MIIVIRRVEKSPHVFEKYKGFKRLEISFGTQSQRFIMIGELLGGGGGNHSKIFSL